MLLPRQSPSLSRLWLHVLLQWTWQHCLLMCLHCMPCPFTCPLYLPLPCPLTCSLYRPLSLPVPARTRTSFHPIHTTLLTTPCPPLSHASPRSQCPAERLPGSSTGSRCCCAHLLLLLLLLVVMLPSVCVGGGTVTTVAASMRRIAVIVMTLELLLLLLMLMLLLHL